MSHSITWKQDNVHLTNIQEIIPWKNEISYNLFVDTHPAQKVSKRRKYIQVGSQQIPIQ